MIAVLSLPAASISLGASARAAGGTVYVNEMEVLTLRSGSATARQSRAEYVASRVRPLNNGSPIAVEKAGSSLAIKSGTYVIMNVIRPEAKAYGTSPESLASRWAQNLRRALAVPPLVLEREDLTLPPGGGLTIGVSGSEAGSFAIHTDDPSVAAARRTSAGLRIDALTVGTTGVTLSSGSAKVSLVVSVAPYAATFPQSGAICVTGDPTLPETLRGAIEGAVQTQIRTRAGAVLTCSIPELPTIGFDDSTVVPVRVKAAGEGLFENEGLFNIAVRNLPIGYRPEGELWYCNDPENVKSPGPLFAAYLNKSQPARILYHHINEAYGGLFIGVQLINDSNQPARVMVIPGDSRPDKNPVLAGYVAGEQFIKGWAKYSGEVISLPPRTMVPIAWRRLAPQETMSGLAYLRLVDGPERVLVRTDAISSSLVDVSTAVPSSATPWRSTLPRPIDSGEDTAFTLSQHIYPKPFKIEELTYRVGGPHGFVRIGQRPIERQDRLSYLEGNFGVMYTIQARIDNPTDVPANVEAVFEASAGYTGALFLVNGEFKAMRLLQPKEEAQIMLTRVGPRAFQDIRLVTLPLSGSSYPATVTIRTVDSTSRQTNK